MPELILDSTLSSVRVDGRLEHKRPERAAIVASFAPTSKASVSLNRLVLELERLRYQVVVVRASDSPDDLDWPERKPRAVVVHKPNIGYDFGSWAVGMKLFPSVLKAEYVLLANDSMVGPFGPLDAMISDFESSVCDVWGATSTLQFTPHLQSYMLGFHHGVLRDPSLATFWSRLRVERSKEEIIVRQERGLSAILYSEGFSSAAWFEAGRVVDAGENPSIVGWRRLLELGFPFVKRELLVDPDKVNDGKDVPATVQERFDINPLEWL